MAMSSGSADAVADVDSFVRTGPVYSALRNPVAGEEWHRYGKVVVEKLKGASGAEVSVAPSSLEPALAARVYHLYLPMYFWMRELVAASRAAAGPVGGDGHKTVVVGLSAPQGCGKTTVVEFLTSLFHGDGFNCVAVSIDDFYLRGDELDAIASANPDNTLLQGRGNAGTHDLALWDSTLQALCKADQSDVDVPVFDKSLRGGKGDRAPIEGWRRERTPCDVVLVEGWMGAFKARDDAAALSEIDPGLPTVNDHLRAYQALDDHVDGWCVIAVSDRQRIFDWRLQAEHAMAAAGRPGMDDEAVRKFVARYMPAYEAYCPALYDSGSGAGVDGKPTLMVHVNGARNPVQPS